MGWRKKNENLRVALLSAERRENFDDAPHKKKKWYSLKGKWNGLGGKMETGETPEECVVREVREESGLRIKDPNLRAIMTFPQFDGKNDWIVFFLWHTNFPEQWSNATRAISNGFLIKNDGPAFVGGDKNILNGWNEKSFFPRNLSTKKENFKNFHSVFILVIFKDTVKN